MKMAGNAKAPKTVTIGDLEGADAWIIPPIKSNPPIMKQSMDSILIVFPAGFLEKSTVELH